MSDHSFRSAEIKMFTRFKDMWFYFLFEGHPFHSASHRLVVKTPARPQVTPAHFSMPVIIQKEM